MSVIKFKKYVIASSLLLSTSLMLNAQEKTTSTTEVDTASVTESISLALQEAYIFPSVAAEVSQLLAKNQAQGAYNKYTNLYELSQKLTQDIRSINNDVHLNVVYTPQQGSGMRMVMRGGPGSGANPAMLKKLARDNYGFKSIDILEGNIGYINLTSFVSPTYAGDTAAAAMQYLYHTDAIIFDLRDNRGGAGEMYQLLASYLFDEGPVQLNEIYWPGEDRRYQTWTLPHLPGKRMPNKDIYILTSANTGSAAEVFSYTLKHHKRATIIGETTVGAANPISPTKISKDFTVWMSKGEAKHPITKTNWEGKGVIPHIQTTREEALATAHLLAIDTLSKNQKEDQAYFNWFKEIVNAKTNTPNIAIDQLNSYAGTFVSASGEERIIQVKNGALWYGATNSELTQMTPLSSNSFMIPGDTDFKLQIELHENKVKGINRLFSSGRIISMQKKDS